jgi:4-aminobutyrate aminotransferase-like enzyme
MNTPYYKHTIKAARKNMQNNTFFPFFRPYYSRPLTVKKAKGTKITDTDNKEYLDCYAGVATLGLGHCHAEVDRAFRDQIKKFGHISHIYKNDLEKTYSIALGNETGMDKTFFVNSGSEAVDLGLCLAREAAVNPGPGPGNGFLKVCGPESKQEIPYIIALDKGYHGGSWLSKSVTGLKSWHFKFGRAENILFAPAPDCSECAQAVKDKSNVKDKSLSQPLLFCIQALEKLFIKSASKGNRPVFIIEPVLGVGGIIVPPVQYFEQLNMLVKKYSALLVCDEIQTGFARCGKRLFGYQRFGLDPHIAVFGKAIANGYPLGAVAAKSEIALKCRELLHFNTFGGHPGCIAAARAVLDSVNKKNLAAKTHDRGLYFIKKLKSALSGLTGPDSIRGVGYLIGIKFKDYNQALKVMENAAQMGLLAGIGGKNKNILRLEPALIFTKKEIDMSVQIIGTAVKAAIKKV